MQRQTGSAHLEVTSHFNLQEDEYEQQTRKCGPTPAALRPVHAWNVGWGSPHTKPVPGSGKRERTTR